MKKFLIFIFLFFTILLGKTSDHWRLLWYPNSESDMSHYEIYRGNLPDTLQMITIDTLHHSSKNMIIENDTLFMQYIDDDIPLFGQNYYYALRAVDSSGLKSWFSKVVYEAIPLLSIPDQEFKENETSKSIDLTNYLYDDDKYGHTFKATGFDSFAVSFDDYLMNIIVSPTFQGTEIGIVEVSDPDSFFYEQGVSLKAMGGFRPDRSLGISIRH